MKTDVLNGKLEFTSLKPCNLDNFTKEQIKDYFNNTFDVYESLFYAIKDDSYYYLCPDRLRLPLIFYYGHTAAVYVNKLVLSGLAKPEERICLSNETIFETGVDEMSWDDIEHFRMGGNYNWPTVKETKEYRFKVKKLINDIIDRTPLELPVKWDSQWWSLFMGFEHERIHLETSSVLIRQLPIHMVSKPPLWKYAPFKSETKTGTIKNEMVQVAATDVRLGKDFDYPSYGWDNEYGRVDCRVTEFEASKFKITNEEFLEFIKAKGYETREYWTNDGWEWLQYRQLKHPSFWICPNKCKSGCGTLISSHTHCQSEQFTQNELKHFENFHNKTGINKEASIDNEPECSFRPDFPYKLRLMFDVVDMPHNWPVEVVYHEAKAFCKWKGDDFRLISEAEHHAIRDKEEFDLNASNDVIYQDAQINHNLSFGSSTSVDFYESNTKGFHDVFGNVWEWCEDHFNGLPGFKTTYLYDDFSSPCFDGRHNLIMGGSWISTGDEASRFARYMFRRHFLQHCGFRLVRSITPIDGSKSNPQIRLVENSVFVLGAGFPNNEITLNKDKLVFEKYETENKQYIYDCNTILLEKQLDAEYGEKSDWFEEFNTKLNSIIQMKKNGNKMKTAVHLGSSTGRITFELAKIFEFVVGVDFCGLFIDTCLKLQANKGLEYKFNSGKTLKISIKDNQNTDRICFKQMSWIPNEIPKCEFVLFSMIDRVMNQLSWLKRFREIVDKHGILMIYSENSLWDNSKIEQIIGKDFTLIEKQTISKNGSNGLLSVWKLIKN